MQNSIDEKTMTKTASNSSFQLVNEIRVKSLMRIFESLDSDNDGMIQGKNLDISNIEP